MHLSEFRILDITDSLWLLLISLLILGIILLRTFKAKNIVYIALALSLYGCAFCWFIIYVFGEGYTGIPFILISWVFIFSSAASLIAVLIKHFQKSRKTKNNFR